MTRACPVAAREEQKQAQRVLGSRKAGRVDSNHHEESPHKALNLIRRV
jgi:hypothetical protein